MDSHKLSREEVFKTVNDLFSHELSERKMAFEKLCLFPSDSEVDLVCEIIQTRGEKEGIYWLMRYLVGAATSYAHSRILSFANSGSEIVREEVCSAIARVNENKRVDLLLNLLNSQWTKQVSFAAEQLG
ncbi:MAG: hypothetical protein P9M03_10625, partial [Candidatus Theseobacter exili]|nr:hypothetical protein [Candidatus Theseobacter exili]